MAKQKQQTKTVPYNFIPREYQLPVLQQLDGGKKRAFLRWHRRAGKDKICWCYMVKEAAKLPGNYFYVFPTKEMAKKALWENIDKDGFKLIDHLPEELIERRNNQELLLVLKNNATIRIVGLDTNPDAIRGVAAKGVVFSEFAFSDYEAYKVMIPSIKEAGGWLIINSTPNGRNHFYQMDQRIKDSKNWHYSCLQTLWPDKANYSGLLSPEEITESMEEDGLLQEDVDREYGVSFNTGMKGSFYADQIEKAYGDKRIGDFLPMDGLLVDTFWDLGVDDSTAVWFRQTMGNKLIFIDYFEDSGKDLRHYTSMLREKGYEYRTHYLPHDASHRNIQTGIGTSQMFADLCREYAVSDDIIVLDRLPVQDGINAVRKRFSQYCFDQENCKDGIAKVELYHRRYDKRRQVFLKEPVHDHSSHAADALRMEAIAEVYFDDPFYNINHIETKSDFDPLA